MASCGKQVPTGAYTLCERLPLPLHKFLQMKLLVRSRASRARGNRPEGRVKMPNLIPGIWSGGAVGSGEGSLTVHFNKHQVVGPVDAAGPGAILGDPRP